MLSLVGFRDSVKVLHCSEVSNEILIRLFLVVTFSLFP